MSQEIDFLIIDGDSFIHRIYHGYKTHSSNSVYFNEDNFLIKGFAQKISKTIDEFDFKYIALVLDDQGKNFRHDIYPDYKKSRIEKDDNFKSQINKIHKFMMVSGIPCFSVKGVEGDDVIGVLAKKAQAKNFNIKILSSDKDLAQILNEKTQIIDTKNNKKIDLSTIEELFGVKNPLEIVDYLSLLGDKADNIIGVEKCGSVTARKIIEKYKNIESLINADHKELDIFLSNVVRNKKNKEIILNQIINEKEKILLAKKLISLKLDLNMELKIGDIKLSKEKANIKELIKIAKENSLNLEKSLPKKLNIKN